MEPPARFHVAHDRLNLKLDADERVDNGVGPNGDRPPYLGVIIRRDAPSALLADLGEQAVQSRRIRITHEDIVACRSGDCCVRLAPAVPLVPQSNIYGSDDA